jgi:hypothetical protein
MSSAIPIPGKWIDYLNKQGETGPGYQVLAVRLKDGKCFDQVVVSEGCVIQVRGYIEVPFTCDEVISVEVNHRRWNFREFERA